MATEHEKTQYIIEAFNILRTRRVVKTWTELADLIGVNRSSLSSAKNGKPGYVTDSMVARVEGLLKESETRLQEPANNFIQEDVPVGGMRYESHLVPTLPYKIYKAVGVNVREYIHNPDVPLHMTPAIAQFSKTDCHYFVGTDAMQPYLHQSDLLALQRVNDGSVVNGEVYVINSKFNGLLARFVYDEGDTLLLKASPAQDRYTPMRVEKSEVYDLYRVLGLVRTNI